MRSNDPLAHRIAARASVLPALALLLASSVPALAQPVRRDVTSVDVQRLANGVLGVMSYTVAYWGLTSRLLRGTAGAAGIALANSLGNVGGLVGPSIVGVVERLTGNTSAAFLLVSAMSLVAAMFFVAYRKWAAFAYPEGRVVAAGSPPASFATRVIS